MENKEDESERSRSDKEGHASYAVDLEDLDAPEPEPTPETTRNYIGLTASAVRAQENAPKPLPKGVEVIIWLLALTTFVSFFDSSQNSLLFMAGASLNLILGAGLYCRWNLARLAMIGLSSLLVVLSIWGLVAFIQVSLQFNNTVDHYHQIIAGVEHESFTPSEIQQLQSEDKQIKQLGQKVGKVQKVTYFKYTSMIVIYSTTVAYLTRPKVRNAFEPASDL